MTRAPNPRPVKHRVTRCKRGHLYDAVNSYVSARGYRHCRHCQTLSETRRKPGPRNQRRITVSFAERQIRWLRDVLAIAYRGGDVGVIVRGDCAVDVMRIVHAAAKRADALPKPVKHKPRTHCKNGHPITEPDSMYVSPRGLRWCRKCAGASQQRWRNKVKEKLAAEAEAAA